MIDLPLLHYLRSSIGENKLPGIAAQMDMMPDFRSDLPFADPAYHKKAVPSAVMVLLVEKEGCLVFPLIQRTASPYAHSRQISLPGGRKDSMDVDLVHTAIREAHEEIGVLKEQVHIIGELTRLFIPPSNYIVTPVLAYADVAPNYIACPQEVEYVFDVNVSDLLDDRMLQHTLMTFEGEQYQVPYFHFCDHIVWGATAMILSEFKSLLKRRK